MSQQNIENFKRDIREAREGGYLTDAWNFAVNGMKSIPQEVHVKDDYAPTDGIEYMSNALREAGLVLLGKKFLREAFEFVSLSCGEALWDGTLSDEDFTRLAQYIISERNWIEEGQFRRTNYHYPPEKADDIQSEPNVEQILYRSGVATKAWGHLDNLPF